MPVVIATGSGKAVIKPAALQIIAKRLEDVGPWRVAVVLAVELTGARAPPDGGSELD